MPKKVVKKKSSSKKMLDELQLLNENIEELIQEVKKLRPDSTIKSFSKRLFGGVARGIGFVLGTLLIGGIILFLGQQVITSGAGNEWINDIIEQRINEALPNSQIFNQSSNN